MMRETCVLRNGLKALFFLLFCAASPIYAQQEDQTENKRVPFKERIAFKTNATHWIGLVPNIGIEFDLSNSIYNKWTIGAQASWNGHTDIKTNEKVNFALNDYRAEVRRYIKPSLKAKKNTKRIPKFWRTYYLGAYAGYTQGNIFIKKGLNGKAVHAGITGGWETQLYRCKNGAIDLDLGLSIGVLYAKYDTYRINEDQISYTKQTDKHFIKYPLPTDLRIGFTYRFKSIRYKYNNSRSK